MSAEANARICRRECARACADVRTATAGCGDGSSPSALLGTNVLGMCWWGNGRGLLAAPNANAGDQRAHREAHEYRTSDGAASVAEDDAGCERDKPQRPAVKAKEKYLTQGRKRAGPSEARSPRTRRRPHLACPAGPC
jgi:hypothetical protein